jgi:serine phosphatase RsbU (regulator of sigma subunit)/DNA-binding NarL/FixJ family response regulator
MPIRVAIVDDQPLTRSGLNAFIRSAEGLDLVGEATNGEEAIQLCELVQPDVVVMDLKMPIMDGISATRVLRQRWPDMLVLGLANFVDKGLAQSALEAGASGYLVKDITAEELADAIRQVYHERKPVVPRALTSLEQTAILEQLQREIDAEAIDASRLANLLRRHLPAILPGCQIEVRLAPGRELLTFPADGNHRLPDEGWSWLLAQSSLHMACCDSPAPWDEEKTALSDLILAPVLSHTDNRILGGMAIWTEAAWTPMDDLLLMVEGLAQHISRALSLAQGVQERPARQNLVQELEAAAKIQADLLPARMPKLPGWEFAARLNPALETSGDFYDVIALAQNHWGLVMADVSDKGMGAALFMALSSTLIRTYAIQYPTLPALAISTVNERILKDTRSGMFVTAFYGVLDPVSGRLRYVNAGHNPPILVSRQKSKPVDYLRSTGMALGVMGDMIWKQKVARLSPGDVLVMYTDGVTDAQDERGLYYGEQRLLNAIRRSGSSAQETLAAILEDLDRFTSGMIRLDDITLLVLSRNK